MEQLFYYFKPYIIFAIGFLSGNLDHWTKWIAVISLLIASLLILFWRYKYRKFDYEEITMKDVDVDIG